MIITECDWISCNTDANNNHLQFVFVTVLSNNTFQIGKSAMLLHKLRNGGVVTTCGIIYIHPYCSPISNKVQLIKQSWLVPWWQWTTTKNKSNKQILTNTTPTIRQILVKNKTSANETIFNWMAGKIKFYLVNQTKYSETYMWFKEVLITFWKN